MKEIGNGILVCLLASGIYFWFSSFYGKAQTTESQVTAIFLALFIIGLGMSMIGEDDQDHRDRHRLGRRK